jgi:cysteine desulfurase
MYGPRFGVLCKKQHVPCVPIIFGGGQERKLRAGTENVPYALGFAEALTAAQESKDVFSKHIAELKKYFIERIKAELPESQLNGNSIEKSSSPLITNFCFQAYGVDAEFLVLQLDAKGVAVSAMTACKSLDDTAQSYVVKEVMGEACASASIRFSFGKTTTQKELDTTIEILKNLLESTSRSA